LLELSGAVKRNEKFIKIRGQIHKGFHKKQGGGGGLTTQGLLEKESSLLNKAPIPKYWSQVQL
jgi:hypothetical protein